MNEIRWPKPLPNSKIIELFKEYQNGNEEARDTIIAHNTRLAVKIAQKFSTNPDIVDELASIGMFGLIKAVDKFDCERKINFSTLAGRCIINEILMGIRKDKKLKRNVSLSSPITEETSGNDILTYEDTLRESFDLVEAYEDQEEKNFLKELIVSLPKQDYFLITMYYGFFGNKTHEERELADMLNISRSYVSRKLKKIIQKLKAQLENPPHIKKRRGRKAQTIFQLIPNYSRKEIMTVILSFNEDEQILLKLRYGEDLDYPRTSPLWNSHTRIRFYSKLLPKIKSQLELNQFFNKTENQNQESQEELYFAQKLNAIYQALLQLDMLNASILLNEYLKEKNLMHFEKFIINLIILSIKEKDFIFTRPIINLVLLTNNYHFDISHYRDYFYEALTTDLDEANLYLEILINLKQSQNLDLDTTTLTKTYELYLTRKKNDNQLIVLLFYIFV